MIPPQPVDYLAPEGVAWIYTGLLVSCCVILSAWLLLHAARRREIVPVLVLVGGLISCLTEPMWDHLGLLWWPPNLPGQLYTCFDVHIPLLVPAAYTFWAGAGSWALYLLLKRGITRKRLLGLIIGVEVLAILFELPWTAQGAYVYYTDQPFEVLGYPLWWAGNNTNIPLLVALVLLHVLPRVTGVARVAFCLLLPACAWGAIYGLTGWPTFVAFHSNVPEVVKWLAAVLTMSLAGLMTWLMIVAATPQQGLEAGSTEHVPA